MCRHTQASPGTEACRAYAVGGGAQMPRRSRSCRMKRSTLVASACAATASWPSPCGALSGCQRKSSRFRALRTALGPLACAAVNVAVTSASGPTMASPPPPASRGCAPAPVPGTWPPNWKPARCPRSAVPRLPSETPAGPGAGGRAAAATTATLSGRLPAWPLGARPGRTLRGRPRPHGARCHASEGPGGPGLLELRLRVASSMQEGPRGRVGLVLAVRGEQVAVAVAAA